MRGEGITKLDNGKWRATVTLGYDAGGKQIRKSKTAKTKKEATQWRNSLLLNPDNLDLLNTDIKFSDLSDAWIAKKEAKEIAKSTLNKYRNCLRIVKTAPFYNFEAKRTTKTDVEDFLHYLAVKMNFAKSYIIDIRTVISGILYYGVEKRCISFNPAYKAELPRTKKTESKDAYTIDEFKTIKNNTDKPFGDIVFIMISTGLRPQEICAVNNDFIVKDGERYFIEIKHAMKRQENGIWKEGDTKTESSERKNPLPCVVADMINSILEKNAPIKGKRYLIPNSIGTAQISYNEFLKKYKAFINSIGIRYLPPHCCRHTHNTILKSIGIPTPVVMKSMGHTKEDVSEDYTHIPNDIVLNALNEMQKL